MRLTTQSGIVPRLPYSGQILIVQAGGAFTLEELSLAAPVFLAIMTWLGWVTPTENQTSFIACDASSCSYRFSYIFVNAFVNGCFPLSRFEDMFFPISVGTKKPGEVN